jgi:hypothetical protein
MQGSLPDAPVRLHPRAGLGGVWEQLVGFPLQGGGRGLQFACHTTQEVGNIEISFVEYSASKNVRLQPDIVKYSPGDQAPMYDFIIESRQCMT